jgi:hypothetical protein
MPVSAPSRDESLSTFGNQAVTADRRTKWLARRVRYLPDAIESARARLARLEAEAQSYGFYDLVRGGRA